MAESQILSVIRVWAAVAWADGVLAEAEADGLRRLIAAAELTDDERTQSLGVLEQHTPLPDTYLASLSGEARRGVYRAACRMAVVDHVFESAERTMLDRLRDLLQIPAELAADIESDIPGLT